MGYQRRVHGVHCYPTELGTLVAMAARIAAVITLASLCAAEPGDGYGYGINAVAYHPYGGYSSEYRSTQGLTGYGGYHGKREAEPGYGYGDYQYVSQGKVTVASIDDNEELEYTEDAFNVLGFEAWEKFDCYVLTAGVMTCGGIVYIQKGRDE